jgi:hypothetical protein
MNNFSALLERACKRACKGGLASGTVLALAASHASATVYPVDDSATIVHQNSLAMQWRSATPGPRSTPAVDARTVVSLSLNTQRWVGKHGRVFMLLAPQPVRCQVIWTTRGLVLGGRLEPGQRTLVFDGVIPGTVLADTLELSVTADGRELQAAQRLHFSYEIEVQP